MKRELAGRYRLLDRLGSGGMSEVWRAYDEVLDREVAVKVLDTDGDADPDLLHRIRMEARSAARLRHPHVVEVHDYGETEDGVPYVVMELVDGRSLADLMDGNALPWRMAVTICAQVAAALAAAHAHGVVHRDVKPSNVMVTSDGVKLVDFGISATVGEADGVGGEVFGTPAYLAPERLRGGMVRPATDVYALGLLLYLTVSGRLPWSASTTTQMLSAHRYLEPDALPPVAGLPFDVADLCRRCTAKRPDDRPTAAEAARILADAAGLTATTPLLAALDAPTAALPVDDRARRLAAAFRAAAFRAGGVRRPVLAAAAVLPVLAIAGIAWFNGGDDPGGTALTEAPAAAAPAPALTCTVAYAIRSAADGRVSTAVTIGNTGTAAAAEWVLAFDLADGQQLVRGWSQSWAQEGTTMEVRGAALPAGGRIATGFDARYAEATTLPARFTLNGTECEAQLSVAGRTVPPTAQSTSQARAKPAPVKPAEARKDNSGPGSANQGKGKDEDKKDEDKGEDD